MYEHTHICIYFPLQILTYICILLLLLSRFNHVQLCDPIGRPPGFLVPGILKARTLEWVAISFSNICICIYLKLSQFAEHQKLRQHCELTVLQFKTKQNKKGKKWMKKMLNSASHHRNTNQNHNEAPSTPVKTSTTKKKKKIYK